MMVDHGASAPTERPAMIERGVCVLAWRVNGILMLSRAIGDRERAKLISCEPYISVTPFREEYKMIIACDGVWDVISDQNAAHISNLCEQWMM
jgi:serine/threonine protein phosphatase PrpC